MGLARSGRHSSKVNKDCRGEFIIVTGARLQSYEARRDMAVIAVHDLTRGRCGDSVCPSSSLCVCMYYACGMPSESKGQGWGTKGQFQTPRKTGL